DLRRVLFRAAVRDEVAERRALHLQAALADRGEVRAARDERHVVPRARETRPVVAADRSRSANRKLPQACPHLFVHTYTRQTSARTPRPASDCTGRSTSVLSTNAADVTMNTIGTIGYAQTR